jgi:hypothetical protein
LSFRESNFLVYNSSQNPISMLLRGAPNIKLGEEVIL